MWSLCLTSSLSITSQSFTHVAACISTSLLFITVWIDPILFPPVNGHLGGFHILYPLILMLSLIQGPPLLTQFKQCHNRMKPKQKARSEFQLPSTPRQWEECTYSRLKLSDHLISSRGHSLSTRPLYYMVLFSSNLSEIT